MAKEREVAGSYPYTRGIYPEMYRRRLWTRRQYAGFGSPKATNERFKYLLNEGETGLSVAFDLPTQLGYDPDQPQAQGEVGLAGVSIVTYEDFRELLSDLPLDQISLSFTINGTAPIILAMLLLLADEQGVSWDKLRGTLQNDPLKEYTSRGAWLLPPQPSCQVAGIVSAFIIKNMPHFNPLSVSGYHIREAGATAVQELAYTLLNGEVYLNELQERGIAPAEFARRVSFFWSVDMDLFGEAAKLRAARRLWAKLLVEKYQVSPDLAKMRFHTQTAGSSLKAVEPLNNISRVTIETMAAVLGGTQSHHACSYDEALNLPSAEAAQIAIRTQQIIAAESGVVAAVDPLGGSYYVEELTDRLELLAQEMMTEIRNSGGVIANLDRISSSIREAAGQVVYETVPDTARQSIFRVPPVDSHKQLIGYKAGRDGTRLQTALRQVREALHDGGDGLIPTIMTALKAQATLGEIAAEFRTVYGDYREPLVGSNPADVLIAKVGLDGHDRGAWRLYWTLCQEGQKVAYSGRRHTADELASMAKSLGVKALRVSILSGAHRYHIPRLQDALRDSGIQLSVGGCISYNDRQYFQKLGIKVD